MVGFNIDKGVVNQRAGSLAWQLRTLLADIDTFKAWLDTQDDAALTAIGFTGSSASGEIQLLRASFTDLSNLSKVAHGQATQPALSNFFFNAGKLTGVQ